MPQRKKNQNKENSKGIKRNNLQQINYTEQLRMQTTNEFLHFGQSIELEKSHSRKPGSRKSRCISVKQYGAPKPVRFKHLFQQFHSMKLINEQSKSPRSNSKSRPKTKKSNKKITQTNSRTNSSANLTEKIERRIDKLRRYNFFNDEEDSQIPLVNTSEAYTAEEHQKLQVIDNELEEEINITEIRLFCNQNESSFKKTIEMLKGNVYEIMAKKIQRAWRRYRTHQLICRYAKIIVGLDQSDRYPQSNTSSSSEDDHPDIVIQTESLYPQEMIELHKVTHVSDLEQPQQVQIQKPSKSQHNEADDNSDEQIVKDMKREELRRLNQVINLLADNKKMNDPKQKEKVLEQLMLELHTDKNKSESNHQAQLKLGNQHEAGHAKTQEVEQRLAVNRGASTNATNQYALPLSIMSKHHQHRLSSHSSDSVKNNEEEFNSKKYIEYLDSDMYPINQLQNNPVEPNYSPKICSKKQNLLLTKLGTQHVRKPNKNAVKVGMDENVFELEGEIRSRLSYRSNSQFSQENSVIDCGDLSRRERNPRNKQNELRKSNSQKILKMKEETESQPVKQVHEESMESQQELTRGEEMKLLSYDMSNQNLSGLMKKQIQDFDFELQDDEEVAREEQFDRLYSEQELTKQLAELKRLRDDDYDEGEHILRRGEDQDCIEPILQRSSNQPIQLHQLQQDNFDLESDEENYLGVDLPEKAEKISQMAFHCLVLELLKEMARHPDTIIKNFKLHSVQKSKVARAPTRNRKNGFATNQAEVRNFVEHICSYLVSEHPQVFNNLEKSTGPSALEMLRYMHQTEDDEIILDEEQDDPSVMVLPNWAFDNYWARKSQSISSEKQGLVRDIDRQRHEGLKSLNKIFYRSLFDCLNECLDFQRNFGPFGRPFPWKKTATFDHQKKSKSKKKSIERTQKRLLDISSTYCGIIIDREEMMSICGNEEYLGQVQEDRLSRMLAQDLIEGEDRWIFYDDEQTQLLVQTSNFMSNELMSEAIEQLIMIKFLSH